MTDYTEEQRAIIQRMSEISARLDAVMADDKAAHENIRLALLNWLATAITRSNEIGAMQRQWGDAFREFLNTL